MAKRVYERWSIKWDASDPNDTYAFMPSSMYVIDIGTLESADVTTSPEERVMCVTRSGHKSDYDAGLATYVYYGYAGEQDAIPRFYISKSTLAHRRIKDEHLENIILEEGTVPDDGIHTDGYWYVKPSVKWIYEQWEPAWPELTGLTYPFATTDGARVLSYDGTLQDSKNFSSIVNGEVFYWSSVRGNPNGYYLKSAYTGARYLGTEPPLPIKSTLVDIFEAEEGMIPDDGIYTDGYWYVKVKLAVKWVYERWTPKWPDTPGESYSISSRSSVEVLSYDGTLGVRRTYSLLDDGTVFYRNSTANSPEGYYRKTTNTTTIYLGTDPPLPIKDTLVDTIEASDGIFPDDGVHSDQLYYLKLRPVFPIMRILRDGQWAEAEAGFVLKDGVWKPIVEVYKLQDGHWVQA